MPLFFFFFAFAFFLLCRRFATPAAQRLRRAAACAGICACAQRRGTCLLRALRLFSFAVFDASERRGDAYACAARERRSVPCAVRAERAVRRERRRATLMLPLTRICFTSLFSPSRFAAFRCCRCRVADYATFFFFLRGARKARHAARECAAARVAGSAPCCAARGDGAVRRRDAQVRIAARRPCAARHVRQARDMPRKECRAQAEGG